MSKQWNTVYISGGGSGIGYQLGRAYAARGSRVAIFDLRIGDEVRAEFEDLCGANCCYFEQVDVLDTATLDAAVARAREQLGTPELAVNSAGIQLAKSFVELSGEDFSRVIDLNLVGSRNFGAALLPHMARGARLVFIASLAGLVSNYHYAAYNASKFGVVGLAGALRMECIPRGIDVTVVCPPEVMTPMVEMERETMHPITHELKQVAGSLALAPACKEIMAGIDRGGFYVVPGFRARLVWRLNRWFPGLLQRITDRIIRKMSAEHHH